jgi:two-component system OmpR family response regulator
MAPEWANFGLDNAIRPMRKYNFSQDPIQPFRRRLMTGTHILVVDDDPKVRTLLRRCFEGEGFTVSEAGDGAGLRAALERSAVTLITLDLNLGRENGLDLAREIRKDWNTPIIMLTGKGDAVDRIVGLELGADDYLAKPFELRELLARVRAVLRRSGTVEAPTPQSGERYLFDGWVFDISRRSLERDGGARQELTTSEFNLLEAFVMRPHRALSRDDIMDLLKGHDWSPLDRSIDNLVARLRKKVEQNPDHPSLIKTVRGVGYIFTAEIKRVTSSKG